MFEDRTYENLLREALDSAPLGTDTRQGSIFYDAVAGICLEIARFYAELGQVLDLSWIGSAPGEYLDRRGFEYGVERRAAERAVYGFTYTGQKPADGTRFFTDGLYFVFTSEGGEDILVAEEAGEASGGVEEGTRAVPVSTLPGLRAAYFGTLIYGGADAEDDESYRERIIGKIATPAENGSAAHYRQWCEECAGIGRARIFPLWDGENTVLARLIGTDGLPAGSDKVAAVQEYIDPDGSGLGEGKANIGAHFTAAAAKAKTIDISFTAALAADADAAGTAARAEEAIGAYFREKALSAASSSGTYVRVSDIGALLYGLGGLLDYSALLLNGGSSNISVAADEVPVLGEVTVNV